MTASKKNVPVLKEGQKQKVEPKENMEAAKASLPSLPSVEIKPLTPNGAVKLSSILRAGGVSVDISTSAIIYGLVAKFMEKGTQVTIDELNSLVAGVISNPEFAGKPAE